MRSSSDVKTVRVSLHGSSVIESTTAAMELMNLTAVSRWFIVSLQTATEFPISCVIVTEFRSAVSLLAPRLWPCCPAHTVLLYSSVSVFLL